MKYNPFGPAGQTVEGAAASKRSSRKELSIACGYNYVIKYDDWKSRFSAGPLFGGY